MSTSSSSSSPILRPTDASSSSERVDGVALTETDKFQRFEDWLRVNGACFDMLELRAYEEDVGKGSSRRVSESDSAEEKKEKEGRIGTPSKEEEESEMRGVHAKVGIASNTVCIAVPRRCLITVEMGQATEIGQAIINSDLDLDAPKHIFLMVFLLWDRKVNADKSFFKPYYDILPKTLRNMPIFWTPHELDYLNGSYLLSQIADRNEAITDDYHAICDVAPQLEQIASLDEFKWARMCVCSRNFGLQIDGHRTSALVPYADMLNHYRPRETKWTFDDERQAFTITTLQHIPACAQVYDSYGQKCNHRFLLNYGFAVEDNREVDGFCPNEVPIELVVPPSDPLLEAKQEFLTRGDAGGNNVGATVHSFYRQQHSEALIAGMDLNPSGATNTGVNRPLVKRIRVCVSNNENTRILFGMLRVLACDETELRTISATSHTSDGCSSYMSRALLGFSGTGGASLASSAAFYHTCPDVRHPLNIRNERAAMELLWNVVGNALAMYPTTLTQDIADLSDESVCPRFSNRRHAKIQVRGEKEVLHHFARWSRAALNVMDVIEKELAAERRCINNAPNFDSVIRAMEQEEEVHHPTIVRYCADVLGALRREEMKTVRRH